MKPMKRNEIIEAYKKKYSGDIIHSNQLTTSELQMLDFCIDHFTEQKESEVRTAEDKLYQCPYERACKCNLKDCCLECETFGEYLNSNTIPASQFQQPEITDENIIVNIRRILVDYHRRDDYDLTKAENDMLCLFRNTFVSLKEQPSDEGNERLQNGRHYLMGVEPKDLTVEDALEAFGFGRNGLKD